MEWSLSFKLSLIGSHWKIFEPKLDGPMQYLYIRNRVRWQRDQLCCLVALRGDVTVAWTRVVRVELGRRHTQYGMSRWHLDQWLPHVGVFKC